MPDPLWINASAGAPAYTAAELRQAMGLAMMYDGRNMGVRKGVRPGGNQLSVSLVSTTITVQPGLCALDPALTTPQGSYWVAIPVAENHTLTAADPTNPRKDIVIARVYDHDEDSSGLRLARSEYLVGTPAGSPAEPALPASAIKLALIDVPASGGGSPVVTDRRQWTVAAGGILPVADTTERDAVDEYEGLTVWRRDTNAIEVHNGLGWATVHPLLTGDVSVVTADSATFTTTETQVQTVTVPLVTGRTYKVCWMPHWRSTVTGDVIIQRIRENTVAGNELQLARLYLGIDPGTTGYGALIVTSFTAVATGNKTFSFTGVRAVGSTGTHNLEAGTSHPCLAWVEYWYG